MFSNAKNEIKSATTLAEKAMAVFNKTIDELKCSNDKLTDVIRAEEEKINESELNIMVARDGVRINNTIISKLKEFVTT